MPSSLTESLEEVAHLLGRILLGIALPAEVEESAPFELLLTDQTMPRMTGIELIRHCRAAGHDLPVLLMSGYLPDELMGEADRLRAGLLAKPFERSELIQSVRAALASGGGGAADR
jgi:CheY-like chemotaxis protein